MTKRTARKTTDAFVRVRTWTEQLAAPLSAEDQVLQSMPDASPTKWHRAHTTWFFETFLLAPRGVPPFHAKYNYLFNSYYEALGKRHVRARRGMLSRPSVDEITEYRRAIDARMVDLLGGTNEADFQAFAPLVDLGLAHEEQHQELILTDILHALAENPLEPVYLPLAAAPKKGTPDELRFVELPGGLVEIGAESSAAFAFDNELPRHKTYLEPYALADRLVTVGEMKAFIEGGGYRTPALWLSDGWSMVQKEAMTAPLYASFDDGVYRTFSLHGMREPGDDEPVLHLSFYEADAIAHFLGGRLPTEAEWESACTEASPGSSRDGAFAEDKTYAPRAAATRDGKLRQMFGDAWEWTSSSYSAYPGFAPGPGAVGEYNGKFMVGQYVLRGGSLFTPRGHVRSTYRNFWPPHTRFQATGVRVAKDLTKRATTSRAS